jgi:lipoyl(octanoyl) transferase
VTYHGPGQVVAYPLVNLQRAGYFVKEYVYRIEESVIRTLAHFGVTGHRVARRAGHLCALDDPFSQPRPTAPAAAALASAPQAPDFTGLGKIAALGHQGQPPLHLPRRGA